MGGLLLLPVALACLVTISSCGNGNGGLVQVNSLAITPTSASVNINGFLDFTAAPVFSNTTETAPATTITWLVNGVAGGNLNSIGSIGVSTLDAHVGIYTGPPTVPNPVQVTITATTPQVPGSTTNTNIITSNSVIVTIGIGTGLSILPTSATVFAGQTFQFSASLNDVNEPAAIWSVTPVAGANVGSITQTGLYTAPPSPPPGGMVTINAASGTDTATAIATIAFSDASLTGPFTFSYSGSNSAGFVAEAGSFFADGLGHIVSGVEDSDSFSTGVAKQVPIVGTYVVGPDGRTTAKLSVGSGSGGGQGTPQTFQFAMANFQHGAITRFDAGNTGSGTVDQQNLNGLTTALSTLNGPYVFSVAGADAAFFPQGMAGKFSANAAGQITGGNPILDANNSSNPAGSVTKEDRSLTGSYTMDPTFPGSGRGTLTLTSASTGTIQYAFYIVGTTAAEQSTQLHLVEIDTKNYLAGDVYAAPTGNSFNNASLASGNYPFVVGGTSPTGAYAAGGVFISSGSGATSGVYDSNNAGTVTPDATLNSCTYTVDPTTGRVDLQLCPPGLTPSTQEFAMYQSSQGPAVMLELDATAVSTGVAYVQGTISTTVAGNYSFGLAGQGIFQNQPALIQQNLSGQVEFGTLNGVSGNLDINNFNAVYLGDPIFTTNTTISAPDTTSGRGTAVIQGMNPNVTYNLTYYIIGDNTALLFDSDSTRILIGRLDLQF
jgi:hypothetical protein